jgi:hypothetical protein
MNSLIYSKTSMLFWLKNGDSIPKTAETEIASTDLYDDAVRTFSDLVSEELGRLKMSKCYGCSIQHPSQKQHDCLAESTVQMIEELLDEAIECVHYEKVKKAHLKLSPTSNGIPCQGYGDGPLCPAINIVIDKVIRSGSDMIVIKVP